ncbi:MAG: hypothetical protein FJ319_06410 [SAR202 cluster bacterium]|nr:hypothetical protein [SAR202 cluster bacterium]
MGLITVPRVTRLGGNASIILARKQAKVLDIFIFIDVMLPEVVRHVLLAFHQEPSPAAETAMAAVGHRRKKAIQGG